jgi:hypothetical protein
MDDPEKLRNLIEDVIRSRDVLYLWAFLLLAVVAGLGSFLGSFLKKKGENYATHTDAKRILDELEKTTKATKEIETRIARRSDLEKQILLDQYKLVVDIQKRLVRVATELNRRRSGIAVPDLIKGSEVVPLTAIFEDLERNRWLLKQEFYDVLLDHAKFLLKLANITDSQEWTAAQTEYQKLSHRITSAANNVFGIETIKWT